MKAYLKYNWWKWLGVILIAYSLVYGLLGQVPELAIINESIRNLYYHVPMWFAMIFILLLSMIYSILYLNTGKQKYDLWASEGVNIALMFGALGLLTGMLWAKYTWGEAWSGDPKQNGAAVGMLIYLAYIILRSSVVGDEKKGRLAAVYNVLAYPIFVVMIFVLPRLTDSLHPGSGGNPGFNAYDLDSNMRLVFYPAVLGWILLGCWMVQIRKRTKQLEIQLED